MKKRIKKRKFKGTRYVAKVLQKYFKRKYPNYKSALPKAREVASQLKASGQKFTIKNVEALVRKHRIQKAPDKLAPKLFYKLMTPTPYYGLLDYNTYIKNTTSEVEFISDIFNPGMDLIEGGSSTKYSETFSNFVNYCNRLTNQNNISSSDEITYYVVCTEPVKDKTTNKWISEIISVDQQGKEIDLDYTKTGPTIQKTTLVTSKQKPSKQNSKDILKTDNKIRLIESETKKLQAEQRLIAMKLFLNKDISKLEFKQLLDNINNIK